MYYHEKSVEEVAEIVGIPEATVKTRMFYARKKLSELLKKGSIEVGHEHDEQRSAGSPKSVELLLPWHAAGTLSRRDAERVEQALANDPELARRYALVREELGETIHLNETLGAPSARAMEKLFAKIDAEPVRKPKVSLNLGALADRLSSPASRRGRWLTARPRRRAAIVLQAGILAGVFVKEGGGRFHQCVIDDERGGRLRRGPVQPAGQRRRHHHLLADNKASIGRAGVGRFVQAPRATARCRRASSARL